MNKKIIPLALAGMLGIVTAGSALADNHKACAATVDNMTMSSNVQLQLTYLKKNQVVVNCKYNTNLGGWQLTQDSDHQCTYMIGNTGTPDQYAIPAVLDHDQKAVLRSIDILGGDQGTVSVQANNVRADTPLDINPFLYIKHYALGSTNRFYTCVKGLPKLSTITTQSKSSSWSQCSKNNQCLNHR